MAAARLLACSGSQAGPEGHRVGDRAANRRVTGAAPMVRAEGQQPVRWPTTCRAADLYDAGACSYAGETGGAFHITYCLLSGTRK